MINILDKVYFSRPATELAPELIGKILCRRTDEGVIRARITETECYFGEEDSACHAHKGRTPRTDTLYQQGGITYIYLCYGIHSLLNIVTGAEDHPEAVLIRGVEGASGPGRVTKRLGLTTAQNRIPLCPQFGIWVEDDGSSAPAYEALPRVGIDYAAEADRSRPWRYLVRK